MIESSNGLGDREGRSWRFRFQVSCTPIWNIVSLKLGRIRLWHFKQSWRSRIALQLWLLQLVPKLNILGVTRGGRLMFQSYFWGGIRFLNQGRCSGRPYTEGKCHVASHARVAGQLTSHARHLANTHTAWRREKPERSPPSLHSALPSSLLLSLLTMPKQWSSMVAAVSWPWSSLAPHRVHHRLRLIVLHLVRTLTQAKHHRSALLPCLRPQARVAGPP